MLEILLYAIPIGITLSFAAGPIFFVVIETSINKSKTGALILDLGAVVADILYILLAFFGSQSFIDTLKNNPWVALISGVAVIVFGLYYVFKSREGQQFQKPVEIPKKRFLFLKGFFLNFLNVGVFLYWVATTMVIGTILDHNQKSMIFFYIASLSIYLIIDIFKIYFANRFKSKFQGRKIQMVEKIMGFVLIIFGVFMAVRNII